MVGMALACALPVSAAQARPLILGANTEGLTDHPGASLESFAHKTGEKARIAMFYRDWDPQYSTALISPKLLRSIRAAGAEPMIKWEPTIASGVPPNSVSYSLDHIAGGSFDGYIKRAAKEAAAYRHPLLLCPAHEMNGTWEPWGYSVMGNTPRDFIAAWRHIVKIFRRAGANNVRWVWNPNVYGNNDVPQFEPFYPGNAYVDIVGLDGYNFAQTTDTPWRSFQNLFGHSYKAITRLTHKPLIVAETSSTETGGNKARWIRKAISQTLPKRMPRVRALVWFDRKKETDWRVNSSKKSLSAFRREVAKGRLSGSVNSLLAASARAGVAKRLP